LSRTSPPSRFFEEHVAKLREAARLGPVVDLACGRGRHAVAAAMAGARVIGFDRDQASLVHLRATARERGLPIVATRTDLEAGYGIPVKSASCGAILVFRFLFRPLATAIRDALAPGGLLLYESYTTHQPRLGSRPRNPAFLLRDGELLELFETLPGLEIFDYWEGWARSREPEAVARLAAQRR
jgi:SAM-dependent methyltransferase